MNNPRTTCGPLYAKGLQSFAGDDPDAQKTFAAGFVSGQAEKIYLGACHAAMFRPSEDLAFLGLSTSRGLELWICNPEWAGDVASLRDITENSSVWHVRRGQLCGVPDSRIDRRFHERQGWGEKCD